MITPTTRHKLILPGFFQKSNRTHHPCLRLGREVKVTGQMQLSHPERAKAAVAVVVAVAVAVVAVAPAGGFEAEDQVEALQFLHYHYGRFGYDLAGDGCNCLSGQREEVSFRNGFAGRSAAARIQVSRDVATSIRLMRFLPKKHRRT
jgi:hypothetical protein